MSPTKKADDRKKHGNPSLQIIRMMLSQKKTFWLFGLFIRPRGVNKWRNIKVRIIFYRYRKKVGEEKEDVERVISI